VIEEGGFARIASHRSGETEDATIADLSVFTAATQIRCGRELVQVDEPH